MKTNILFIVVPLFFLVTSTSLYPQDKKPDPQDFAGKITVTRTSGSLLVLELPEKVYQGLQRPDLGDLRVFDADGILVPFTLRTPPGNTITLPEQEVPFFIWKQERGQNFPSSRNVEIDVSGTIITINETQGISFDDSAYLIDLSSLSQSPAALHITFDNKDNFFNSSVVIHTSSGMNQWQLFNKQQTVVYYGNPGTDRNMLEIPDGIRYALVKFNENTPLPGRITASFKSQKVAAALRETQIMGEKRADSKVIHYDTMGYYPVSSVDFRLKEPDSMLVQIINQFIYPDGPSYLQRQERLFRINTGAGVRTNTPIAVSHPGRHWTLSAMGETLFTDIPECYIIWEPLELIFLARGDGPWTIAYGNSSYSHVKENELLLSEEDILLPAIITGESYTVPKEPDKEKNWSFWVLWGILIFAAGVLTALAFYIARSMNVKKQPPA